MFFKKRNTLMHFNMRMQGWDGKMLVKSVQYIFVNVR